MNKKSKLINSPSKYHLLKPFLGAPLLIIFCLIHIKFFFFILPKLHILQDTEPNHFIFFLLFIPILFPSIGYSLLILNCIFYLIKPIRDVFEEEAKNKVITKPLINTGHKIFAESQKELFFLTIKYLMPFGYSFVVIGIFYYLFNL